MSARPKARKTGLLLVVLIVIGAALGWYGWQEYFAKHRQSTDNAYVNGPVVTVTAQLPGTVIGISANNTDYVEKGQLLVQLDPAYAELALEQAKAQLGQTVREVRALFGNNDTLAAEVNTRKAEVERARSDVKRRRGDVERRRALAASGAVSKEEFSRMQNLLAASLSKLKAARAAVAAAEQALTSSQALTANTSVMNHPRVTNAASRVREAMLNLDRTAIRAPVSGYVAKRRVQLGQRAEPGRPILSVIPLDQVWVEANFKENQLGDIRIGQPVRLSADVYGKSVIFDGTVEGLGAGTGAAFALLPAQNATGNWIKVIQRIPVRIALNKSQLATYPLQIGLSMRAEVSVADTNGPRLATVKKSPVVENMAGLQAESDLAQLLVTDIITRNLTAPAAASAIVQQRRARERRIAAQRPARPLNLAADAIDQSRALARSRAAQQAANTAARKQANRVANSAQQP
ncbi:MAG: HlyD family efflux transporter periplasmic adaptor subunit [Burkholderiaceae bacterium]